MTDTDDTSDAASADATADADAAADAGDADTEESLKHLGRAASCLRDAEELVEDGDLEEQIQAEAEDLEDLAERDRAPDQRRVRGHHHTLREFHGRANEDALDHLSRALDHVATVKDRVGPGSGPK